MKLCKECLVAKEESEFYKSSGRKCKSCADIFIKEWNKNNPESHRKAMAKYHAKAEVKEKRRVQMQQYRESNPDYVLKEHEYCKVYNEKFRNERSAAAAIRGMKGREFIQSFKCTPCVDCGGNFPPECMDFDHVRGTKTVNVGEMVTYSLKRISEEISKCDLVCSNCHRIRTQNRNIEKHY